MSNRTAPSILPEIVESYRDFAPPAYFKLVVENLLRGVPQKYLAGLKTIVLANRAGLTRDKRRQKVWSRGRKIRLVDARGAYYKETKSSSATVWLYVDNIVNQRPNWPLRLPIVRYMVVGDVLYHEIGHHIHEVHRPVYAGKENVAEEWGRRLGRNFIRRRYWYLYPLLYLIGRVLGFFHKRAKRRAPANSAIL